MCHLYLTKCQYKSDLIHEYHVCLKRVITRTHYRWKDEYEKHVYRLKHASLRPGLPSIHTDPTEIPDITSWEVEAALRDMKNGTATGNDNINIETLKPGEDTISKTLAKLYTKCLSERRLPAAWKNAKMMIIFKKGNKKDLKNYRPICLLSNIYNVLTKEL